ncbi:MAG: hypothetical protein J6W40_04070 [Alphaproteobacteria bacterium]|nr:hypothetical protein [Alphaproteobacteria bacterium]
MFGKIKRVFFVSMFGILYAGFIAQLVYVLGWSSSFQEAMLGLAALSLEWLILIAARYLSKRSSGAAQYNNNGGFRRR